MKIKFGVVLIALLVVWPLSVTPQQNGQEFYDAGFRYEAQANWNEAIESFQNFLKVNPDRADVWLRLSDLHAKVGNIDEVTRSLEQVVRIDASNPSYYERLSQAYAIAQNPNKALDAIKIALKLDPDNVRYLRSEAQLAGWANDNRTAMEAYSRLLGKDPSDSEARLGKARVHTWIGDLDDAAVDYKILLESKPGNRDAWIEYARVEMWRGDFHDTLLHLEKYKENGGDDNKYSELKARAYAWSGRLIEARKLVDEGLRNDSENYDLNVTNTITLANNDQPREAVRSLDTLFRLQPDNPETLNVSRFVRTPLRDNIQTNFRYYRDSDGISISTVSAFFNYFVNPETRIFGGGELNYLDARLNSGYENIDGTSNVQHRKLLLGVAHRFSPKVAVELAAGGANTEGGNSTFVFDGVLRLKPSDRVRVNLYSNRDYFIVSPRSVSLGVTKTTGGLLINWRPTSRTYVDSDFNYSDFNDGNSRYELSISPRTAILRRENFNLDLGVRGWWYGFDKDLNNGYYDPNFGQAYFGTSFIHWKINQNNSVNFVTMAGIQKDTFTRKYKFATNGSVEGLFGIYRDVMFRIRASGLNNSRTTSGAFRGYSIEVGLTFRF